MPSLWSEVQSTYILIITIFLGIFRAIDIGLHSRDFHTAQSAHSAMQDGQKGALDFVLRALRALRPLRLPAPPLPLFPMASVTLVGSGDFACNETTTL